MNILFLTYGLPYPPDRGARIRDFHIIKNISRYASVHLLSLLDITGQKADQSELLSYCSRIDFVKAPHHSVLDHAKAFCDNLVNNRPIAVHDYYHPAVAEKLAEVVSAQKIDIIQVEHSFLAPYITTLPEGHHIKTVLDFHNIGFQQYRRMVGLSISPREELGFIVKALLMRNWENRYAKLFDHCLVTSEYDAGLLKEMNQNLPVSVIPNGVDLDTNQLLDNLSDENTLLMIGTMGYPPNEDAVLYFCRNVLPVIERRIPFVKLLVAGHAPSKRVMELNSRDNIEILGSVLDVLPYYERASAAIVPLRGGGGTRLKILEAMALGVPVVSTSIGCEGLNVQDDEHLLIGNSASEFADRVISLLENHALKRKIIRNARKKVEHEYGWEMICHNLWELYEMLST